MKYFKFLALLVILSGAASTHAQNRQVDSLKAILDNTLVDTSRVNILNQLAASLYRTSQDEAIKYSSDAIIIARQINFQTGLATAYKNIGLGYYMLGDYIEAFKNWELSLEVFRNLGDDAGISNIIGNQGSIYYTTGKSVEAIESYLEALKIAEKLSDSTRIATLMMNIGLVYSEQPGTLDTAMNYYLRAMKIGESIGYADLQGLCTYNAGELFFMQESFDSALFYFEKSIALLPGVLDNSLSLNYIGRIYAEKGDYVTAIGYQKEALDMVKEEDAKLETATILLGMASTFDKQGIPRQAIKYYEQAKSIAEETGLNYQLSDAYKGLASNYARISDYRNAYKYRSLQDNVDNAIYRAETDNKTNNLMFSYQLEKKQDEIEILERESIIDNLRSRRQRAVIIVAIISVVLLFTLTVLFFQRFRFIRRTNAQINAQNREIEAQRDKIEAQRDKIQGQHDLVVTQKEMITDSINYAQRIQKALLPSQTVLDELLQEYFVLYKPKDIVSGDFYWVKEVQDHVVMVGADCTGHGVPGGFMSMLGITLLDDLIGDRCFDAPGAILEQLRARIKTMLVQDGSVHDQKDGMDMAIAILNRKVRELHFSGANNPLYLIRRNNGHTDPKLEPYLAIENGDYNLYELKGDKQPIGIHWEETPFTTRSVSLQEKDTIYVFSDGFIDQFGGEHRKKFKSLNFKKLLLSIQHEPMEKQQQLLDETYENWRGNHEQIDDVSVIGVKI